MTIQPRPSAKPSESLQKRLSYLGLADFDYLSARVLYIGGFGNTGLPKAMEAFEKLFKLFILLHIRITEGRELSTKDLKHYGHGLTDLFDYIVKQAPFHFEPAFRDYFKSLEEAYPRRYPEHWTAFRMDLDLGRLDTAYRYFRNLASGNFPAEDLARARHFGTFIFDAYSADMHARLRREGGLPPADALVLHNRELGALEIDHSRIWAVLPSSHRTAPPIPGATDTTG